ncbi:unnamed protein product [Miscanthus lutarioriparius]|uniref:Uncharacterized protein n=1 Tax=Miscanthus lutarioriparius TaxID=422564 RepID=A0A811QF04_9POAL|nr:unnamed protein product [Miscanthus lutarioriparius]
MASHHTNVVYQLFMDATTTPLAQWQWLLLLLVPCVLLLLLASRHPLPRSNDKQRRQLPLSHPGLPIIGHLLLVGDRPHVPFRDLAAKHYDRGGGGLMLLRLGMLPIRTKGAAFTIVGFYRCAMIGSTSRSSNVAFAPYGEHWGQVRKLVTTHLLTVKKVNSYHHARQEEVRLVLDKLREAAAMDAEVDLSEMMNAFANDIICRAVCGKFSREEGRNKLFRELNHTTTVLLAGFNLESYFPGLAKSLGVFVSNRKVHQVHKRWDDLLEEIISDHERRRRTSKNGHDFTDVMLSVQQEYNITRDHIKAILMDMFEAGTATSSSVLEAAMAELMRSPHLMTKLQAEVRKKTPKGQEMVREEDLADMPYLRAVVMETLRLHPPAPLLVPHQSMADCDVDGYTIPSGTRVIINVWAISRDPRSWENPEEFVPERFVDGGAATDLDFKGNDFQFTPFGAGRRMCPGINFGLATINIMLANLVYCFDWKLPAGVEEDIDMTEVFGLTVHRKETLILVPKPHA